MFDSTNSIEYVLDVGTEWLETATKEWVAIAIQNERVKAAHKLRNYKRAQARARSRERRRSASMGAAPTALETMVCGPNAADSLAVGKPQTIDNLWDAIESAAKAQ